MGVNSKIHRRNLNKTYFLLITTIYMYYQDLIKEVITEIHVIYFFIIVHIFYTCIYMYIYKFVGTA